jgi:hypothetical protein
MKHDETLLVRIKKLFKAQRYRIRIHAIRHMIEEGFTEENLVEAVIGKSKIIENYPDDCRCLILGSFPFTRTATSPLHIVCDYSRSDMVDVVTAYIPQRPWWVSPTKRGRLL